MGATALIATAVGSGGLQAAGQIAGGVAQDRAARAGAEEAEFDARLVDRQAKSDAKQERRRGEEIISQAVAIRGASGVKVNRGSSLRARSSDQAVLEESISNILFSGKVAVRKLRMGAANLRQQGKAAKIRGFMGAGSSILSSVSQIGGIRSNAAIASKLKSSSVAPAPPQ